MRHLEELLAECPQGHRKLVITDSLFSMDGEMLSQMLLTSLLSGGTVLEISLQYQRAGMQNGRKKAPAMQIHPFAGDFADLAALVRLRRKYGFLLALDDAHATFVCGNRCLNLAILHCD